MRVRTLVAVLVGAGVLIGTAAAGRAGPDLPPPPPPDRRFYVERIAKWVETYCAECHRAGGGALMLADAGLSDAERFAADFDAVRPFVNPKIPWESRLYLKILDPADGGDPHVGGAFVRVDEDEHDALLDFVSGATLQNLPPEVYLGEDSIRAKPGETVILDGRDSYDRDRADMDHLTFLWTLYARPPDSQVSLSDRRASRLELTPDVGGSYVVKLRVGDGKVWSAARSISIEVFDHYEVTARDPGGISGLADLEPRRLQRIRRLYLDVLGRGPTPAEAIAEDRQGVKQLARTILVRAESGRAWFEELTARFGLLADFRPESEEAVALPLRAPSEATPPAEMERVLVLDPAFLRRHPPGRSLALAVARLLLEREPTAEELAAAATLARGVPVEMPGFGTVSSGRVWLDQVTASAAFRDAATLRRLRRFLPSGDAKRRLREARIALDEGGGKWRALLVSLLQSSDYLDRRTLRAKDDLTFVRSLFFDLLERKPTDRELAALLFAVRQMPGEGAPFAALAKVMIDSGEVPVPLLVHIKDGPKWLADRFLRYLGRAPTEAERRVYGEALVDVANGGGVELVIYALLTGPEYACR